MNRPQSARLEEVVALARELDVLDKVRLLEEVVADLEGSLNILENRAATASERERE